MTVELTTQKRLGTALFYGILVVLAYLVFLVFEPFLAPLAWAVVLVVVSYPVYARLARKWNPTLAATASTVGVVLILIVPALLVTGAFIHQGVEAVQEVQQQIQSGHFSWVNDLWLRVQARFPDANPGNLTTVIHRYADAGAAYLGSRLGAVLRLSLIHIYLIRARKTPVESWYFDFTPIMTMWGSERTYHHTPPVSLIYGLREALRIVLEEGLETRWERHLRNQQALIAGIEAMELELFVSNPADRLVTVTAVKIPSGLEDGKVRQQLLNEFNLEIAGGIGKTKGKIWRVGLMGYSSQNTNVLLFLAALEKVMLDQGRHVPAGAGVAAAIRSYQGTAQRCV